MVWRSIIWRIAVMYFDPSAVTRTTSTDVYRAQIGYVEVYATFWSNEFVAVMRLPKAEAVDISGAIFPAEIDHVRAASISLISRMASFGT